MGVQRTRAKRAICIDRRDATGPVRSGTAAEESRRGAAVLPQRSEATWRARAAASCSGSNRMAPPGWSASSIAWASSFPCCCEVDPWPFALSRRDVRAFNARDYPTLRPETQIWTEVHGSTQNPSTCEALSRKAFSRSHSVFEPGPAAAARRCLSGFERHSSTVGARRVGQPILELARKDFSFSLLNVGVHPRVNATAWRTSGATGWAARYEAGSTGCAVRRTPSARATFSTVSKRGFAPGASAL